jgi:hypothetical protein
MPKSRRTKLYAETYLYVGLLFGPLLGILAAGVLAGEFDVPLGVAKTIGVGIWLALVYRAHHVRSAEIKESLERKPFPD